MEMVINMEWLINQVAKKAIQGLSVEFFLERANSRASRGDFKGAIEDYQHVINISPHNSTAYSNRGVLLANLGEHHGAIQDFTQALRSDPFSAQPYYNRGMSLAEIGEHFKAVEDYTQALKIAPNIPFIYTRRGFSLIELNNLDAATIDFEQAIKLDPKLPSAYHGRGLIRGKIGDAQGSIEDFDIVLTLNPQYLKADEIFYYQGLAYCNLQKFPLAIESFNQTLKINSSHGGAYYGRGFVKFVTESEGALEDFSTAIDISPDFTASYFYRGQIFEELGKFDLALIDYSNLISRKNDSIKAYQSRGDLRWQIGDIQGAIQDYQQVANLSLNKGDIDAYQGTLKLIEKLKGNCIE